MRNLLSYVVIIGFSIVIAGCGGRKAIERDIDVEDVGVGGTAGDTISSGLIGGGITTQGLESDANSGDLNSVDDTADGDFLGKRVVYFDYNSSLLTLEGEAIVQAHASYLASSPGVQIILEGHADERGTREYNLALGEDRAKSVSNIMEALGVNTSRVQIVSYGEERPVALGYVESAFALNRRVEILYQ
jgi:peptidoglycan-associated lipoprotein